MILYFPFSFVALWHFSSFYLPFPLWSYDTLSFFLPSFSSLCALMILYFPFSFVASWHSFPLFISPSLCGFMTLFPSSCLPFLLWGSWIHIQGWRPGTSALQREGNPPCSPCSEITVKLWNFLFIFKTGKRNCLHCVFEELASNYNVVYMPFSLESRSDRDPNCSRLICSLWIV